MVVTNVSGSKTTQDFLKLSTKLASIGMYSPEQIDTAVKEILADVAEAEVAQQPDMYIVANNHVDAYIAAKGIGGGAPANTIESNLPGSNEGLTAAAKQLMAEAEAIRSFNTTNAQVTQLVLEKEPYDPNTDVSKMIQVKEPTKINEYATALVPGEENKKAFDDLRDSIGKQVAAHIPAPNNKVVGFIAQISQDGTSLPEAAAYTKNEMITELVFRCFAAIDTVGSIRLALTHVKPKGSTANNGVGAGVTNVAVDTTPRITVKEKRSILEDASKYIYANVLDKSATEKIKKTLKTEASFKIYAEREGKDGKKKTITQTVRFSGEGTVTPHVKSSNALLSKFSAVGNRDKHLNLANPEELEKLKQEANQSLAYLVSDTTRMGSMLNDVQAKVNANNKGAAGFED